MLYLKAELAYFKRMLEDVSVTEGMPTTFTCQVSPDNAVVTWLLDGMEITPDKTRYNISEDGDGRSLQVVWTKRADSGRVTCYVGELQTYAELTVKGFLLAFFI